MDVFRISEVLGFFEMAIGMCLVTLGDTLNRIPHRPIGSPFGKIAVSARAAVCVLEFAEGVKDLDVGLWTQGWLLA